MFGEFDDREDVLEPVQSSNNPRMKGGIQRRTITTN